MQNNPTDFNNLTDCPSLDEMKAFLTQSDTPQNMDTKLFDHFISCQTCFDKLDRLMESTPSGNPEILSNTNRESLLSMPKIILNSFKETWPDPVGFQIASYEVLRKISTGGMGNVYECRDLRLHRRVALKTVLQEKLSAQTLVRLNREAEILASLKHPNIVNILEFGEWRGMPFIVMEYVEGKTLSAQIQDTVLAPFKAAALLEKIARAMHYAHQQGVLHRDLKPSNILIEEQPLPDNDSTISGPIKSSTSETAGWEPKIIDFGLSKWLQLESNISQNGKFFGTPAYMSPERINNTQKTGPTSDIYAMGIILYECLVGQIPFKAETLEATIQNILKIEPPSPRLLNPNVPIDLEIICLKCLMKDPAKRYQTAQELADELDRFISGKGILARPVSMVEKTWKWTRRNRSMAVALSLCIALLVSLITGTSLFAIRQNELRKLADLEKQKFNLQKTKAEFERNKVTELYVNQLELLNRNILDLAVKDVADLKSPQVQAVQERSIKFVNEMKERYNKLENEDLHQTFPKLKFDMVYHLGKLHKKMGDWPSMAKAFEELLELSKNGNMNNNMQILLQISAANDVAIYFASSKQELKAENLWRSTWDHWKKLDKERFTQEPNLLQNLDSITANLAMFLQQQNQKAKADQILAEFQEFKKTVTQP